MNKQKHTKHYLRRSFGALIAAALSMMMLPLSATAINADDGRVERSIPGDSVYFGSKGGVPIGFDILTAN